MKKTYKMYEAPEAEMIEMQMPVVLMNSDPHGGGDDTQENDEDDFIG